MQKKRLPKKVLSIVLSLLMMLTVIPLFPQTTADAAATEYYYPAGQKYIKDVVICYYKSQSECKANVINAVGGTSNGKLLDYDLTKGTGGDYYVYMGWTWTTNPNEAVRGFRLDHNGSVPANWYQNGVYWYPINSGYHAWVPQLHGDGIVDTNRGAGGDDIKIYITKDPAFGPPVTDAMISNGANSVSGWVSTVTFQDNNNILDLNKGVSGSDYLYLLYKRDTSVTTVNTAALRAAYNNTAAYDGVAGYTPASASALSSARNEAKTIMNAFDNNNGYASYTQDTINGVVNKLNNALNNLQTFLYLDGTTNGGDKDQTITLTVGTSKTATVNLGNYSASKAGADFAGWAKTSLATSGEKGTVTVGFNETWYALFGVELAANFHYLTTDGELTTERKTIYAMNAATAGGIRPPSIKNATIEGRELEFLGWRTDTTPSTATVSKNNIYTIYTSDPEIDLYAVYSSDVTLSYDVNKGEPEVPSESQIQYFNANTVLSRTEHTFTVTDVEPERFGGEFLGWADVINADTAKYDAGSQVTISADKTLYAAYHMLFSTVTFLDAKGDIISEQEIDYADDAVAPADQTKEYDDTYHYVFTGWDTDFTNVLTDLTVSPVFDAIAHEGNYEIESITLPDCLNEGEDIYTCTCGYTKNVVVDALGHDEVLDPGIPATCTQKGYTDFVTCRRCLEVLEVRTEIEALGHDYERKEAVTNTCSTGGYELWVCKNNENHTEIRNETLPTGEHKAIEVKGWKATCTESGRTASTECEHCGSVITPYSIILADGHNLIIDKAVAPKCGVPGLTEGAYCADCDYVVPQEEVPALEHDWYAFTAKAATCTEDGYTAGYKCRYCHEVKDSEVLPALNHDWTINEVAATCTTDGYTDYICSYDAKHNYTVEGDKATGHEGGKATCTEKAECDNCGMAYGELEKHDYVATVIPATCTKDGYTIMECSVCGDSYTTDATSAVAHTYDNGNITTAPNCYNEGIITYTCIYCPDSYTEVAPATGHSVDNWTIEGTVASGDCSDCGEHITANAEDVGLELPECERCGYVHRYSTGFFKYKGIYCSIMHFFRQIINFFKGNA